MKPSLRRRGKKSNSVLSRRKLLFACLAIAFLIWRIVGYRYRIGIDHALLYHLQSLEESEWHDFQADYKQRFGRSAPSSLQSWLRFAKFSNCNEKDYYNAIDEDLQTYRDQINRTGRLFQYADIIPSGRNLTSNYLVLGVENYTLTVVEDGLAHSHHRRRMEKKLRWLLKPLKAHYPPLKSVFFFDAHDHPTKTTNSSLPIFSVCKMGYITDDQIPPTTDHGSSSFLEQPKTDKHATTTTPKYSAFHEDYPDSYESRSLLVPYHFSVFDSYYIVPPGPAFSARRDAILWRGSTTGYGWGTAPRFQLMKQYGGTQVHSLAPKAPEVMADFAFVHVVQNQSGQTLPPGTRFAPKIEEKESKEYKYILDIDGNGKYFQTKYSTAFDW